MQNIVQRPRVQLQHKNIHLYSDAWVLWCLETMNFEHLQIGQCLLAIFDCLNQILLLNEVAQRCAPRALNTRDTAIATPAPVHGA